MSAKKHTTPAAEAAPPETTRAPEAVPETPSSEPQAPGNPPPADIGEAPAAAGVAGDTGEPPANQASDKPMTPRLSKFEIAEGCKFLSDQLVDRDTSPIARGQLDQAMEHLATARKLIEAASF